jgi:glutamate synthase domain-containing protein 1
MSHRGGCGCDQFSGDGTGIMTAIPHHLYLKILRLGFWVGARVWPAQMSEEV